MSGNAIKHIFFIITAGVTICLALNGCIFDSLEVIEPENGDGPAVVGEFVNVHLMVDVGDINISSTRAEGEDPDLVSPEEDTDAERKVDGIWVFQFDAANKTIVNGGPKYQAISDQSQLLDLSKDDLLTTNNGSPSIVYVVANVGSSSWVTTTGSFTLSDLESALIPNPEPIYADDNGNPASAIPMGGQTEEEVIVNENSKIFVPVYRMFAKLMVKVGVDVGDEAIKAIPTALDIGQVPNTCSVGTIFTDSKTVPTYPESNKFLPWTFSIDSDYDSDGYFVIYVPENIQGETDNEIEGRKGVDAPANALMVTTHLDLTDESGATIKADPQYTVYPGGNVLNNFNIRRNCVYRVKATIEPSDVISPSANCLVAKPGDYFAFYPYVRDETGHRPDGTGGEAEFSYYNFEDHLNPEIPSLTIYGVKIIWQTEGAIGDNSKYDKVKLSGTGMNTKIYVQAGNVAGNALIAAYDDEDCTGTILWSWHIWVTDLQPDNVDKAVTYYHYDWDENGINRDAEVVGYPVMNCNLGALALEPGNDYTRTYGMLYQWGRKDPFPPVKSTGGYNGKFYGILGYYDYGATVTDGLGHNAQSKIDVYDNGNVKINLGTNTGLKSSGTGYEVFNTYYTTEISPNTQAGGIDYSIHNPTMFIASVEVSFGSDGAVNSGTYNNANNYMNNGDWLPGSDNDLWGGNETATKRFSAYSIDRGDDFTANIEDNYGEYKTIFDPCPYGWRVSPGDLWLGFTKSGRNFNRTTGSVPADSTMTQVMQAGVNTPDTAREVSDNKGFHMYMQGWKGELGPATSFFPTQGSRLANGQPFHAGICGNYHNATVDEQVPVKNGNGTYDNPINRVDILHFHNQEENGYTQVNPFEKELIYYNRAVAGPVRCVRDTMR